MEGYKRVDWTGSGNCFAGHWFIEYELDENQQPVAKAQGLEAWNRLWKHPEQNPSEIPAMALELAKGARLSAPARTRYFGDVLDGLRKQHSLAETGPDISLIGPGDAYVRALAASGHPVSEEDLRPERPDEGPVLLLRKGKLIKAYGQLDMAMQDAMDGDVLELRTDGTVPGGLTVGTGRHLTIRSAPGYRPIIDGLGEHNDRLSLEGLLLQGGILSSRGSGTSDPAKPYASEGGFERIINCSLVGSPDNGQFIGGWLYPKNGQTPIIQNCDFSHIGFAVAPKTHATISNSIFSWMRLSTTGTPETFGSMTFDRCLVWYPYLEHGSGGNALITFGPSQIQWNRTVLAAAYPPFSESAFASMGGFTGDNNAFLISTNWMNHRLEAFRKKFALPMNGVELAPLEFDPAQWRICRELSPGYKPRPDGSDYGVDLDRLTKAIAVEPR